jgi:hypothetical protein
MATGGLQRIDDHEKRLDAVDDRLNRYGAKIERIDLALQGDLLLKIPGLAQRMDDIDKALQELIEWRNMTLFYLKMVIVGGRLVLLLMVMILGTMWWPSLWPQVQVLIKIFGG